MPPAIMKRRGKDHRCPDHRLRQQQKQRGIFRNKCENDEDRRTGKRDVTARRTGSLGYADKARRGIHPDGAQQSADHAADAVGQDAALDRPEIGPLPVVVIDFLARRDDPDRAQHCCCSGHQKGRDQVQSKVVSEILRLGNRE